MYAFCLFLSLVATALGVFAIGFGIPNHDFSVGSTLIISGATGVAAGIVMFGIAAAVRQLRRIADALAPRAAAPVARRPAAEGVEAGPVQRPIAGPGPAAARIPYPPRPGTDQREPRAPDQREARFERPRPPAPPQPAVEVPEPPPRDRSRPNIAGAPPRAGEAPLMEEHEEVPLSPARAPAAQMRGTAPPVAEPSPPPEPARPAEPRPSQADIMARLSNLASAPPRPAPRPEPPRAPAPPPPPPPAERPPATVDPRRPNMFDALWPAEVRAARQSQSETIARAPRPDARPEARPEPRSDLRPEPRADTRPEPRFEPRLDARPEPRGVPPMPPPMPSSMPPPMPREPALREPPPREPAPREPTPPPPAAEPRTIAILKSGVIDGMAYTLYTDGSIEAELPQGTMRFASIDDLRSHLENTDRPA
jgi:hypothetical protein